MRTVKHTSRFKRDYKREKLGRHSKRLDAELMAAVRVLAKDEPLPRRYFDHPLGGEWSDHRDCHIRPDLILTTASRTMQALSLSVSVRIASSGYERPASSERARRNEI
jgi:mRNA interferase YafQ